MYLNSFDRSVEGGLFVEKFWGYNRIFFSSVVSFAVYGKVKFRETESSKTANA